MKLGLLRTAAAALAAAVLFCGTARAQINLFGDYYSNVARAACANDAEQVRQLVDAHDHNPNQTDDQSRTGLDCAAMTGNLQIIALLIKANAKLDQADPFGNTALHWAADRNQTEAAKLLVDAGAMVDAQNKNGMTALMIAASHGNLDLVRALLARGANPGKTDYTGRDALSWAAAGHRAAVVEALKRAETGKRS
jgi:ankyrin repeat protein